MSDDQVKPIAEQVADIRAAQASQASPGDRRPSSGPDQPTLSRRAVLGAAALGAGALAMGTTGLGPAGLGTAAALGGPKAPVRPTPAASGVDHIVVVMMENRSFDHMLGWLPGANGVQAGLTYLDHEGVAHQSWHLDTFQGLAYGDPDHSYAGGRTQWDKGKLDGFLKAGTDDIFPIGYYEASDLAFYGQMAPDWVVCDNFHASIMGPTYPNRIYMHTAQTDRTSNTAVLCNLPTIWDSMAAAGVTNRYYYSDVPLVALFGSRLLPIAFPLSNFLDDCAAGTLPAVSFVDPKFIGEGAGTSNDDHPFADVRAGQAFLNQVYTAVTNSPQWLNTVLVITYDEWGGFFDHVEPNWAPDADPTHSMRGFRVPTIVVSPFAPAGTVSHYLFDHTSILALIEWRWGLDPMTVRDAQTRNLAYSMNLHRRTNLVPPQYVVPDVAGAGLAASAGLASATSASSEHLQDWLALADLARSEGYELL